MALYTVSITDGTTLANLAVSAGRGPKGDGWTGVTYDNGTGRFTFTSTDGLGYVSDSITGDLDTAVTEAEAAQAAAEAAQAATENIFDQFGDQYLGPKASDPTVDNDGDPLTEGDIYFNTTDDVLKFYSGTAWVAPESIATTAANEAEASATAAATSETNAASSASAASTSETNAASSASAASTSETNAATSETNAASSASAASTSETNAAASETAAAASEAAAAASETAAATSESNAASSASAASTSASNAATSETNAASSASAASTSETNAANSASAAASSYDQFDDRYLGSKSSAPTVDNDGNALLTGALYWDSTLGGLYVWNSTSWEIAGQRDELLQAVAATKSDTAVDLFVYDTSKDSDGGAWRKRTQGTSWYNETLNTATRGSRKEFPAVAVIVAESNQVTIYDGDDPDLPMWMVFELNGITNGASFANTGVGIFNYSSYPYTVTSISMRNGRLAFSISRTGGTLEYGMWDVNLISETSKIHLRYPTSAGTQGVFQVSGNIAQRNSTDFIVGASKYGSSGIGGGIVGGNGNDVAMTVLPNAPIDAATGLPVPTIAVATDGGVSVIKDDGTVVDITVNLSDYSFANNVAFLEDNSLATSIGTDGGTNEDSYYVFRKIPTSDNVITVDQATGTVQDADEFYSIQISSYVNLQLLGDNSISRAITATTHNAFGSSEGLSVIDRNEAAPANGMVAYTASDYATGYQVGDIKLATLSDTDDTDVTGSELVTNGTFDSNITGWTAGGPATLSHSSGNLVIEDNGYAYQVVTTVVGKSYVAEIEVSAVSSSPAGIWELRVGTSEYPPNLHDGPNQYSAGKYVATFTATTTTTFIVLKTHGTTGGTQTVSFDNVSVRLAEEDRSVNGNGLQVFGTVTKNPVATGADLVAYGGWSTTGAKNNYLYQPYNSDLDFGTNFCFITWVKVDGAVGSQDQHFFDLSPVDLSGRINVFWNHNAAKFQFAPGNGGTNVTTSSPGYGNWHQLVCTASASSTQIYLDGALSSTGAGGFNHVLQSDAYLTIGARTTEYLGNAYGLNGSVALMRLSKTIPSPEQIAKIYEDEKVLFQDGAQATLYGSSDAVTALAYDDTTELLHVGTSAGRSVFQGLRRVDNTTDAVGAAISASNGLVAED